LLSDPGEKGAVKNRVPELGIYPTKASALNDKKIMINHKIKFDKP
jgi:hypothetical protein